ncbi:DNA polymerase-1 [Microbacterium sp. cf046]|uniref:bifunctional 3'-5' exonuclease/DNA polymerase n=1 Tax=Microbacterium sp. cf046 TaxID=1761803 RepID=UPI0008EC1D5F|nr:bifunctional 3'-5' exonuclease/DNA polymerase [Microbacterium sp. cf046]SFS05243.1 DNA polymerase-1 [Microbacterium sp. cf046]
MDRTDGASWVVLGRVEGRVTAVTLGADGAELDRMTLPVPDLPAWVGALETAAAVRWVWSDAPRWYADLLAAGVRIGRCHDLRLCHAILRDSELVAAHAPVRVASAWDAAPFVAGAESAPALFELGSSEDEPSGPPEDVDEAVAEFARQREAIDGSEDPGRLRLLAAAESAGALIAVELRAAGLPWDAPTHDAILTDVLGRRPVGGGTPEKLEDAAARVRAALGDPVASLDSQPKLLRSLHRAGILVESTSRWELAEYRHPVIEPLLEYKKLSRLVSANGWAWLAEWVHEGRFRPVYVPGGVVTGRWASSGGGALQLPRQLRAAVRADPGWRLVIADVAQLEPRVLAAMARDEALADAARGKDLYAGIVETGAVALRSEAKIAMLGAMYGATTGDSGRLVPGLRRTFPRAMALVDDAARTGENGGVVSTWLGRSSPPPSSTWHEAQSRASDVDASGVDETRARRWARDRGRFTRNFVVQGTAAEWALAWMADLRGRLAAIAPVGDADAAPRSGPIFSTRPHLAFFLHDEVIVHAPEEHAEAAASAVREAAAAAGRLLFGDFPIDFPLELRISESAEKD